MEERVFVIIDIAMLAGTQHYIILCKTFGEDELSTEERVPVSTARAAEHCMELGSNVKEISVKKL